MADKRLILNNTFRGGRGVCVWRQPPTRRIVRKNGRQYFLSLPHVFSFVEYKQYPGFFRSLVVRVAFFPSPRPKVCDLTCLTPFPNSYADMSVCMRCQKGDSLVDLCKNVVAKYWGSSFNRPLCDNTVRYSKLLLGKFAAWQKKTLEDPTWIPTKEDMICSRWGYGTLARI